MSKTHIEKTDNVLSLLIDAAIADSIALLAQTRVSLNVLSECHGEPMNVVGSLVAKHQCIVRENIPQLCVAFASVLRPLAKTYNPSPGSPSGVIDGPLFSGFSASSESLPGDTSKDQPSPSILPSGTSTSTQSNPQQSLTCVAVPHPADANASEQSTNVQKSVSDAGQIHDTDLLKVLSGLDLIIVVPRGVDGVGTQKLYDYITSRLGIKDDQLGHMFKNTPNPDAYNINVVDGESFIGHALIDFNRD